MKAILYNKKNKKQFLTFQEIEKPEPKDKEVLVKIFASSINAADYRSMKMGSIPKNKIFGTDISGIVESVGENAKRFKPGDEVVGEISNCGFGGFAEYACVPENVLVIKPKNVSFEDSASIPMAGVTAYHALCKKGKVEKGDKVLIVGCSGGVGTFAVQLAKFFGAHVTGVCSENNFKQTKNIGANEVIDYKKNVFLNQKNKYDLILAINGNYPLLQYKNSLKVGGRTIVVGGKLTQISKALAFGWFLSLGSRKISCLISKPNTDDLSYLLRLANEDKIKPVIERIIPLEKIPEIFESIAEGHSRGKTVVKMN